MGKLVSAIITTHNRLDLLKRAIDSVFSQTYTNIECIVVSDNSTDGTNDYCSELPQIKLIVIPEKESKGGNHARNLGVDNSNGELIAFLDDDDYWFPEKIERQVTLMDETGCGLVSCGRTIEEVYPDGHLIMKDGGCGIMPTQDMSYRIMYTIATMTSLILVKKKLLIQIGKFDENLSAWQEYEMTIRLAQITHFCSINKPLVVYRQNISDRHRVTNRFDSWKKTVNDIYSKHRNLYAKLNLREQLEVKHLYYADGYHRAKGAGNTTAANRFLALCKFYRRLSKLLGILIRLR